MSGTKFQNFLGNYVPRPPTEKFGLTDKILTSHLCCIVGPLLQVILKMLHIIICSLDNFEGNIRFRMLIMLTFDEAKENAWIQILPHYISFRDLIILKLTIVFNETFHWSKYEWSENASCLHGNRKNDLILIMTPKKQDKTSELSKHWSPDSTPARNEVIMKPPYPVNQ